MQKRYKALFILAGAVMIWFGVKMLLAALSAAVLAAGILMIFTGMIIISRSGSK